MKYWKIRIKIHDNMRNDKKIKEKHKKNVTKDNIIEGLNCVEENFEKEDYKKAIECYEKITDNIVIDSEVLLKIGISYYKIGKYKRAISFFDKIIENYPEHFDAWYHKCNALDELKKYKEALRCFEKAIKIKGDSADAWNNKGITLDNLKRYDEAMYCYDRAIQLKPDDPYPYFNKAELLYIKSVHSEAFKICKKILDINKELIGDALILCGKIKLAQGDYDEALYYFHKAKIKTSGNIWPILWEIYAKYMMNSLCPLSDCLKEKVFVEIILDLERLEDIMTTQHPLIQKTYYYWLAGLYLKIDDTLTAARKLEKCIEIKSENDVAKNKMKEIDTTAKIVLRQLFNSKLSNSLLQWWLRSPKPLYKWTKRLVFSVIFILWVFLIASPIFSFFLPFTFFQHLSKFIRLREPIFWQLYLVADLSLLFLLVSPVLHKFKTHDIEVELIHPEIPSMVLKTIEPVLRKVESI